MNLVNWVSLDHQRPIMAHELTHALQDQNFNLMLWEGRAAPRSHNGGMQVNADEGQESDARRAVIEGQAMVVFFDYTLKPYGRTLADTPSAIDYINAPHHGELRQFSCRTQCTFDFQRLGYIPLP